MRNPFISMALASVALIQTMKTDTISAFNRGWRVSPTVRTKKSGKYIPHQGKKECARRVKQMAAGWI